MDLTYSFMLPLLETFQKATGSYGWSLVLLTLFVRACLWPLVAKQTESMQRMSMLSPTLKKVQEKYKHDPELMQKKLMDFYAKNRVNPMGGCLPMLLQLPIFFALFATFSGPPFGDKPVPVPIKVVAEDVKEIKKETANDSIPYVALGTNALSKVTVFPGESKIGKGTSMDFNIRAVDGKLPPEFKAGWNIIKDNKPVTEDLATIDENGHAVFKKEGDYVVQAIVPGVAKEESFGFVTGLGKVASGMALLKPENFDALGLIICFGLTMWLSQKLTMSGSRPKDEPMDEQTRIQQDTMKILPLVTTGTFFFIPLPVGVLIYIVLSNIVQSFQTWMLMRKPTPPLVGLDDLGIDADEPKDDKGKGTKKKKKGKPEALEDAVASGSNKPNAEDNQVIDISGSRIEPVSVDQFKSKKKKKK
ncbi:MAG: membrane protein insertase YidC [Candidatus Obscuribacterales bacterium]|nr:membrane protein insertase YidC [Candidatus Obscuribacterales bacterium]